MCARTAHAAVLVRLYLHRTAVNQHRRQRKNHVVPANGRRTWHTGVARWWALLNMPKRQCQAHKFRVFRFLFWLLGSATIVNTYLIIWEKKTKKNVLIWWVALVENVRLEIRILGTRFNKNASRMMSPSLPPAPSCSSKSSLSSFITSFATFFITYFKGIGNCFFLLSSIYLDLYFMWLVGSFSIQHKQHSSPSSSVAVTYTRWWCITCQHFVTTQ